MRVSLIRVKDATVGAVLVAGIWALKTYANRDLTAEPFQLFLAGWGASLVTHIVLDKMQLDHIMGA